MAGHVQDRWYRNKKDENGKFVFTASGRPVRERTDLYGKGMRYKVKYYVGTQEKSEAFPDKKLDRAKAFLAKVQTDLLTGTYVDPDAADMTLRAYVTSWRKGQSQHPATVDSVEGRLNGLVWPFFGDRTLREVEQTATIRDWLAWMGKRDHASSTRASTFDLLSAILTGAVEDRKIRDNPCKAKSVKRPIVEERKLVPWTLSKLFSVQLALPERHQIITKLGGGLALRQMEIFAFSPDDIDREAMVANIQRQIRWVEGQPVFSLPKRGKTRAVPIGAGVLEAIDQYMIDYEPQRLTLPWHRPDGEPTTVTMLISKQLDGRRHYTNPYTGSVWRQHTINSEIWHPAIKRAGFTIAKSRDGMHAMRHLCASNWLADGVSIKEVSEYLGHTDPGYTLKVYTHLVPTSHQRARAASDKIFPPTSNPISVETA
ncbi:tyrosine-type recombinase/integrase [Actinokineospora sp. HUAS TT18]|uniref:tyrosine-type recombinase/integrase n=1 Tax=Actinokineospora sp. HUAS TT18 TaxID=3447451 RepID=UPI003F5226FB